jgi:hypothetical protein
MKKLSFLLILVSVVSSCKVLSKQEVKSVQALSKAMTTSSKLPSDYTKQYYEVALESNQLLASVTTDPNIKIKTLKGLLADRLQADEIVKGYNSGFGILNKYAELLLAFSDDSTYQKDLSKQKDAFIPSFDTLVSKYNTYYPQNKIPVTSLGGLLSNIIQEVGSRRIRYLQRKYLKDMVSTADTIVAHICNQYNSIDFYKNNKQLTSLGTTLDQNYKTFMNYINIDAVNSNPYNYYKIYDPIYLDWKNKEAILNDLNVKNLKAMNEIKTSHQKLKELLYKKASLKELTISLKNLYASVNSLNESYLKFQKDLTPSK